MRLCLATALWSCWDKNRDPNSHTEIYMKNNSSDTIAVLHSDANDKFYLKDLGTYFIDSPWDYSGVIPPGDSGIIMVAYFKPSCEFIFEGEDCYFVIYKFRGWGKHDETDCIGVAKFTYDIMEQVFKWSPYYPFPEGVRLMIVEEFRKDVEIVAGSNN